MTRSLQRLQEQTFDLCIIGGGASGAGCALDAALRGLTVALVEQGDFACGTSSKSTKLVHGGVRYLEQAFKKLDWGQLRQVRHGLEERHRVLANAPHLARPLGLLTPVFSWWEGLYYTLGLRLYGWIAAGHDTLPPSRWLGHAETLRRLPGLTSRLHSSVLYYDGQMDDARYALALVQTAAEAGAVVANYVGVESFGKDPDGRLENATMRDELTGEVFTVRARLFLNCTGPQADFVRQLANPGLAARIRPSKGVHVVLPAEVLPGTDALLIPQTADGRVVFALPFEGRLMVGTTDQDYPESAAEPVLESAEVDFLLETLQRYLDRPLSRAAVQAGFGGLRPLLAAAPGRSTKGLVRDHEVEHDPVSNLLSLLGGKWTTYRLMAEDAVNAAGRLLGHSALCRTADHPLAGAEGFQAEGWIPLKSSYDLEMDVARHLHRSYGSRAGAVAALVQTDSALARRLHPGFPYIAAEVVYAARTEMACLPRDVLARRIRLETANWAATRAALPAVSALLASELGWSAAEQQRHSEVYSALLDHFEKKAGGE